MRAQLYGNDWCGYCAKARSLLRKHGIEFEEYLIDEDISLEELSEKIGRRVTTVPQIFLEGEYIGGYSELLARLSAR